MTALLVLALLTTPVGPDTIHESAVAGCSGWSSRTTPPKTIKVFRIHRRGSSVPARVETWSFRKYVGAVMRSGAWPAHPRQSAIVGAIAIKQYSWWTGLHTCRSWHGVTYQISDNEQYLRPGVRPWSHVNRDTMAAVRESWGVSLRKHGRLIRTGWTGERCRDGWHLCQDSISERARRGWGWRHLIHWAMDP